MKNTLCERLFHTKYIVGDSLSMKCLRLELFNSYCGEKKEHGKFLKGVYNRCAQCVKCGGYKMTDTQYVISSSCHSHILKKGISWGQFRMKKGIWLFFFRVNKTRPICRRPYQR